MPRWIWKRAPWLTLLSGAGLLGLADAAAYGQVQVAGGVKNCQPPPGYCAPAVPPAAVPPVTSPETPLERPTPPAPSPIASETAPEFAGARAPGGVGESVAFSAPNMMGDMLCPARSVSFLLGGTIPSLPPVIPPPPPPSDATGQRPPPQQTVPPQQPLQPQPTHTVFIPGAASCPSAEIAENNSPMPQDRVFFRYNYFNDALAVTGPASSGGLSPEAARFLDANQYTIGFEKTFLGGLMSVEVQLPALNTLASSNVVSIGAISGPTGVLDRNGQPTFNVSPTAQGIPGQTATQFANMSAIWKTILFENESLVVSGGLGVGIPTGPDSRLLVVDTLGTGSTTSPSIERARSLLVGNDAWALSPYLAFLARPTDRWFMQGFVQADLPLNRNRVTLSESLPIGQAPPAGALAGVPGGFALQPPFTYQTSVAVQTLFHLDFGTGFWLKKDPTARWITGIVPTAELHYTTTTNNAQVATLPGDFLTTTPQNIQVGNPSNRLDLLDLTLGTTFLVGDRTTLAVGFAVPLRGGDNRSFDWEAQVQLNFYFGGPRRSGPNFIR